MENTLYVWLMNPIEAVKLITSQFKWYVIFADEDEKVRASKESHLRVMALRILNKSAKHGTIVNFFNHFGYEYTSVVTKKEA